MPYDLVGANPSNSFGTAFRVNIWLWHDYLIIMHELQMIDRETARQLMFMDGYSITRSECRYIARALEGSADMEKIRSALDEYSEFRPHSQCAEFINLNYVENLKAFIYFLRCCGGFSVH